MTKIFTVGYGNRSIDSFTNLLSAYDIDIVIDVRSYPYSRFQKSYNKQVLEAFLHSASIDYLFMGDTLGGKPKDQSLYTDGKVNYTAVNQYPLYKAAIVDITAMAENRNICLMCCELNPNSCHRKNLIGETLCQNSISVIHINEKGLLSSHTKFNPLTLF